MSAGAGSKRTRRREEREGRREECGWRNEGNFSVGDSGFARGKEAARLISYGRSFLAGGAGKLSKSNEFFASCFALFAPLRSLPSSRSLSH
jgi:hypothetical protein